MTLCLFEDDQVDHLRPLIDTRAVYDLRLAIRSLRETSVEAFEPDRTRLHARSLVAGLTDQRLSIPNAAVSSEVPDDDVLFVNGRFVAEEGPVVNRIRRASRHNESAVAFTAGETLVAAWIPAASDQLPHDLLAQDALSLTSFGDVRKVDLRAGASPKMIGRLWNLIDELKPALARDIATRRQQARRPTEIRASSGVDVHESCITVNDREIFFANDVSLRPGVILNASDGPIYIDEGATLFERCLVKGPCYIGPKTQIKTGANVQTCSFGTYCKVGGEVHDTIFHSLSNKSHPGFLGHSYLGRWCNLGADTNTSNLKNDYGEVSLYDAAEGDFVGTGRRFMGLVMGDHAKCGINTMFNTGTVVGTCSNVYGSNFPPRYLPAFSWGSPDDGFTTYRLDKALQVAEHVLSRRDRTFTAAHRSNLEMLFTATEAERARIHADR